MPFEPTDQHSAEPSAIGTFPQPAAAAPAGLWRQADFRKFWAGQTISVFGTAITGLALPLTAVTVLNASAVQMGVLNALHTLPFLLIGLFAGVWADRSRRRPILIAADLGRTILLGAIPVAMALGILSMGLLYPLVFLVGVATVFFDVSYQAFLPALVGRERLVEGNSKLEISSSAAQIAGPGLAGILVRLLSAPFAIAFDAASFLASAISLRLIHTVETAPQAPAQPPDVWREIREGLSVVFGNRLLWSIAGATGTANLFFSMGMAVYVLYLTRDLGIGPETMGFIFAASAPGALLGALTAQRVAGRVGVGPAIIAALVVSGLGGLLVPLAHGPFVASILIAAGFLQAGAGVIYNVNQVSLRQSITAGRLLGRMNATMRFLVWGTIPLGSLIGGGIGSAFGVRSAIIVGALGGLLPFLWVLLSPVRALRQPPQTAQD